MSRSDVAPDKQSVDAKDAPSEHSPGPWRIVPYGDPGVLAIHYDHDNRVCFMATPGSARGSMARIQSNARLITTAPDGLVLAEMIVRLACTEELSTHIEVSFEPQDAAMILSTAERVIAKATGVTS